MTENELSKIIVHCCFKIHSELGPGLLESVYEELLSYELKKENLLFTRHYYSREQSNLGNQIGRADCSCPSKATTYLFENNWAKTWATC
jgi:PD-(D/E)XK nuclease superfamily